MNGDFNPNDYKAELRLVETYRNNPVIAAKDLLGVDLPVPQQIVLEDMWFKNFVLVTAGRGSGKSFVDSVFACLWAMLFPGQRIGLIGPSFRQSKILFAEVERRWNESPLLQEATISKPTVASDRCYLKFRSPPYRSGSLIEAVPLGDGCLCGDSFFSLSDGFVTANELVPIQDFDRDHQVFKNEKDVWSNGEFRFSDEKYYNGIRDTVKIKTRKGYSIEGTLNHKIKVLRDTEVVWANLESLKIGDYVLIDRSYRWHSAPENVDIDSAYLLGLMLGDGCWTSKYSMSFATKDEELYEAINSGFKNGYRDVDGVHFRFQGKGLRRDWLDFWGFTGQERTKNKCLPIKMLSASREAMSACIRGLYDTDGHMQVGEKDGGVGITIGFTNTSKALVDQLHYILLHYGIIAYKTYRDRDVKWNRVYELLITGTNVKRFLECLGFSLTRKKNNLLSAVSRKTRFISISDYIPNALPEMIDFRRKHRIKKGHGTKNSRHIRPSCLEDRKEASIRDIFCFLEAYADVDHPLLDKLKELSKDSVYYDDIVEIEKGSGPTYDIHVPDGHEYCASGFFSHNSKIRGSRFYVIIADEFAQIPEDIFNTVILPMGATVADPMQNVRRLERKRDLINKGLLGNDEVEERDSNKVIMTSSAYYQFNHMYRTMKLYKQSIDSGEKKYAVHNISFTDMPEGFLSEDMIENARTTLSSLQFRMEYEAKWESDSAGVFKASLVEKCKSNATHSVLTKGIEGKKYILGVDPARASDAFALCLHESGNPSKLVAAWEYFQQPFPEMAKIIFDVCSNFNVVAVHLDAGAGGGGLAIKDLLAEETRFGRAKRILDAEDDSVRSQEGRHILYLFNPSPKANAEAVFASLNLMEQGNLTLPKRPQPSGTSKEHFDLLDEEEKIYETIDKLIQQLLLIEVTENKSGTAHFDVPSGDAHKKQKKDLFTSFILASKKAYDLNVIGEQEDNMLALGIIENRPDFVPPPNRLGAGTKDVGFGGVFSPKEKVFGD
jgi:intein/homing endonuclease